MVWLDISNPEVREQQGEQPLRPQRWTATPRIARNLVEVLPARDGKAHLGPRPRRIFGDEARELLDILSDDRRRGPVYVAGTEGGLPDHEWLNMVGNLLNHTVGLGAAYVLDEEATRIFRREAGESHQVLGGTVRTFLPGVRFGDPDDAVKHRVLSTQRIVNDPERRLAGRFGWRARDITIDARLPSIAVRLDQHFEGMLDTLLIGDREPDAPVVPTPETTAQQQVAPQDPGPIEVDEQAGAVLELCRNLGVESLTRESVREVVRWREAEQENRHSVRQRVSALRERNDELQRSLDRVKADLEAECLEHAVSYEELVRADAETRHLRKQLTDAQQWEAAWSYPAPSELTPPESFDDLLERVKELDHVCFTGKASHALDLDEQTLFGTWAKKTWEALLALEDYGYAKNFGYCESDVRSYLAAPPSGYRAFSANRHAPGETKDVQNNAKLRDARVFPVPAEVDAAERAFMGAHFKIIQNGMISPRLHYLDHTAHTGRVYVGYIGRHLRTKQTN